MLEVLKELKEACATHMGRMVYILQEDKFEAIEKAFDSLSKDHEKAMKELSKEIEKNRALNEICALYGKWLGHKMSDFEFFSLLNEITTKYDLSKEVGL